VLAGRATAAREATTSGQQEVVPSAIAEVPDPAFRVPPYVSTLSKRAATKKAPVDVGAKRPQSRPAPVPVAQRAAPEPIALRAAPEPIAERVLPVPAARWPAPAPGTRWPSGEPVALRPVPAPVPAPAAVAKRQPRPAPAAVEKPLGLAAARAKALADGLPG
jgi:hypothetical protein